MRAEAELIEAIKEKAATSIMEELRKEGKFEELLHQILEKEVDPASAAEKLLRGKFKKAVSNA